MNIGVCFGFYSPLHQGHLDLIMKSKKNNDHTFVFVCGYDNDNGRGSGINLEKRFRIIYNFLKSEKVTVCQINDTKLGIDESMSENNWHIWLQELFSQISINLPKDDTYDFKDTITFYVAEKKYVDAICKEKNDIFYQVKLNIDYTDRTMNDISGTECRNFPLKYWSKITQPFRAYFSHNILIASTASEGKTTLTQDIGKYFGIPYSYEKGRDNCKIKTDPEFNFKDFMYNIYEQNKYNEELICSPQNPGIFISDTDNAITLMYAAAYAEREGFGINKDEYNILFDVVKNYSKTIKWDKIFVIKPSKKGIVDDGERYMPDSDYEIRLDFFNKLLSIYTLLGYNNKIEIIEDGYWGNFCKVKAYIETLQNF